MGGVRDRLKSFGHAFNGFIYFFKEEPNARIHLLASVIVIFLGFYFKVSNYEWIILILCISLVFSFEIINTSIENLSDEVTLEKSLLIKKVKDLGAAAVLMISMSSAVVAVIIFLPKIL